MSDVTSTVINQRPAYIQGYDEALLQRIFGADTPQLDADGNPVLDADGNPISEFSGGLIDDPELFQQLDYKQGADATGLQAAVAGGLDTDQERQDFMDRYAPYFTDAEGKPRFLPEAGKAMGKGEDTISTALSDYIPDAKGYLDKGVGSVDAKGIFDTELSGAKTRADQGTDAFNTQSRAESLLGDARSAVKGGLGQFDAQDSFDRRTQRAEALTDQGLGKFDPSSVDEFMNPYQEKVMDAALAKIDREGSKMRQAGAAKAIGAGAFGGSRSGVQAAETERAIAEQKQNTIAGLMSQGYDKALKGAASADEAARKRALQGSSLAGQLGVRGSAAEQKSYEDAAKRGIGAGQQLGALGSTQLGTEAKTFADAETRMLKSAEIYRNMGLSSAEAQSRAQEDAFKRNLETGRLTGGLGQTVGQLGGAQANIGQGYGQLAGTSSNIGANYAGMAPADLNFMYGLGGKERGYDQQRQDFNRANVNLNTTTALAPYSYGQNFLTGSPSASMYGSFTQAPSSAPNPFLQGVGAYATYQGMNQ